MLFTYLPQRKNPKIHVKQMQQILDFCSNCHQWYCLPPSISTMTHVLRRFEFTQCRLSLSDSNIAVVHCKAGKGARRSKSSPKYCAEYRCYRPHWYHDFLLPHVVSRLLQVPLLFLSISTATLQVNRANIAPIDVT